MMNCIIVDDEQHAIDILKHYIEQSTQLNLAGSTTKPLEALEMVNNQQIDLIFLDIQMPELSGLDLIKALKGKTKIILTTAYSEFALESYELDVIDYLLKPIRFTRFLTAVQKATQEVKTPAIQKADDDYLFVKTESKGKLLKINLADIDYIEGMKNYVGIYCNGKKTMVYTSMKELEERLKEKHFMRVHKSFIIPIAKLTGIEGNMIRLQNVSAEILIGENYKQELMRLIKDKMIQ
ncbi:MAG: LytTR family DNA-binding domain-containing protein [Ginsengibacter sp.]